MRILIHPLPETGHINPTFWLADALSRRGHEVVYTSVLDHQHSIEARGYRCFALHRDAIPKGRLPELARLPSQEHNDAWNAIRQSITLDYMSGDIELCVRAIEPAVIIADIIIMSPLQLVAHRLGIPCLQFSTSLSQRCDEIPPLTSDIDLDSGWFERQSASWEASCLGLSVDGVSVAGLLADMPLFDRFGYPRHHIHFHGTFCMILNSFPEIVLCPSAFDLPREQGETPTYVAPAIDLQRDEQVSEHLQSFVEPERPLVYASLGSLPERYPESLRFMQAMIEMMCTRPEWRAILVTGRLSLPQRLLEQMSSNILVMARAPQVWVLQRAAVFVTHAGLGSIREAITTHTPVVAVPQQYDQFGNSTRVLFHGMGRRVSAELIDGYRLTACIEHILKHDDTYAKRLERLDRACLSDIDATNACVLVERLQRESHQDRKPSIITEDEAWLEREPTVLDSDAPTKRHDVRVSTSLTPHATTTDEQISTACRGWLFVVDATFADDIEAGTEAMTAASDLAKALDRARGAVLARVEFSGGVSRHGRLLVGPVWRCHWTRDLTEPLYDYARWCAEQVLCAQSDIEPALVSVFRSHLERYHRRRLAGAGDDTLADLRREAFRHATHWWHLGFGAVPSAMESAAQTAAQKAQQCAIHLFARRAIGGGSGTQESANRYTRAYLEQRRRFASVLQRHSESRMQTVREYAG